MPLCPSPPATLHLIFVALEASEFAALSDGMGGFDSCVVMWYLFCLLCGLFEGGRG